MNIGAGGTLTQPATIGGTGGITMSDSSDHGLSVTRPGIAPRFAEIGPEFIASFLVAGDTTVGFDAVGVGDATSFAWIVAFDYDTSVFAGGGAVKWGNAAGTHLGALYAGSGVPNNAGGANGDFAFRQDGGAGTSIYMKRAGAWVGIV